MKSQTRMELDAVERHLLSEQADRRRRSKYEEAGLPPMPADSMECRWCGGRLKQLIADDPQSLFCQSLCAPNDSAPYRERCSECRREFRTGRRHAATCFTCDRRETESRVAAEERGHVRTRDRFGEMLRRW